YPIHPSNADRVLALLDRVTLSIIVDDLEVAREWSELMTKAKRELPILVKVDVGFHRCGVDPDRAETVDVVRQIAALPGLAFRGLLSHAGHSYLAASKHELETIGATEVKILTTMAAALKAKGTTVAEISVGSTPTARLIGEQHGVTEM